MEDKESIREFQKMNANCNDCGFLTRDFEKYKSFDYLYTNSKGQVTNPSHRIQYGQCQRFHKPVSFIPNYCNIETQDCFVHRKEMSSNCIIAV